jgi:hypothetical protein
MIPSRHKSKVIFAASGSAIPRAVLASVDLDPGAET